MSAVRALRGRDRTSRSAAAALAGALAAFVPEKFRSQPLTLGTCCALLLAAASVPAGAQPTRALLLPPGGEQAMRQERAALERALAEALGKQRIEVLHARDVALPTSEGLSCSAADCAPALLAEVDAELAVSSALWSKEQAGGSATVSVMLIDRAGERYPADVSVDGGVAEAAEAALLSAQGLRLLGPGPWLEVTSPHPGGQLYIDEIRAGSLPYRAAIAAGRHRLRVETPDKAPWSSEIDIPLHAPRVIAVMAEPGGENRSLTDVAPPVALRDSPAPDRISPWNHVLAGALAVSGALLLVAPIRTLAEAGECQGVRDAQDHCGQRAHAGTRTYLQLAAGGALLVGAGAVWLTSPLRVSVATGAGHALAHLQVTF